MTPLSDSCLSELQTASFTYPEVGATAADLPDGYAHLARSRVLPFMDFDAAAERLMTWTLQERAGLRVEASSPRVVPDAAVRMLLGLGPLSLKIPCRVVYAFEEPDRVGFAYGTLPGHPECGEEQFTVERGPGGEVALTIRAFSRPATLAARAAGPISRHLQLRMTDRYLRALDQ